MHPVVISALGVVVGGSLASVTVIGVVSSQTQPPSSSPGNVSQPVIDYGTEQ